MASPTAMKGWLNYVELSNYFYYKKSIDLKYCRIENLNLKLHQTYLKSIFYKNILDKNQLIQKIAKTASAFFWINRVCQVCS